MTPDLPELLARLETWLAVNVPAIHATLRPGATDAELDALETRTGLQLPQAFRALYRWHDGQGPGVGHGYALGLNFLSLEEVCWQWEMWREIRRAPLQVSARIASRSHPPEAVLEVHTAPGWLGFLTDGGDNLVGLDFNPGRAGTVGQVITFGRDEEDKFVLATSLDAFFREYLHRLESGQVTVEVLEDVVGGMWLVELQRPEICYPDTHHSLADSYPGFVVSPRKPD